MKLDIIIPIKTSLVQFAIQRTIPSILAELSYERLYVVTRKENFKEILSVFENKVQVIDENDIIDKLTYDNVKEYLKLKKADEGRTGWYFQQFLKLGIAKLEMISNLYLVWDADAVVLKPINFFSLDGKVLFDKTYEFHEPYFDIMERLIGLKKQVEHSFISEHLVFDKSIVINILNKILEGSKDDWWIEILENIDSENLSGSGFSEYELYGNYMVKYHANNFKIRELYKTRKGVCYLGTNPNSLSLLLFSFAFDYMSFESWHKKHKPMLFRYFQIIKILLCTKAIKLLNRF